MLNLLCTGLRWWQAVPRRLENGAPETAVGWTTGGRSSVAAYRFHGLDCPPPDDPASRTTGPNKIRSEARTRFLERNP